jgi:sirohydrochlorin ferrochelatase
VAIDGFHLATGWRALAGLGVMVALSGCTAHNRNDGRNALAAGGSMSTSRAESASASPAASTSTPAADDRFGVLVMAHGGSEQWDSAVVQAVEPLRRDYPLEVAFGMADAASLQESIQKLEARGVTKIGVVRLFVSRDSFLERTEQILRLEPGAPERPAHAHDGAAEAGHDMEFWQVDTEAQFALSDEGLSEAPEMGAVLLDRALALSRDPRREDVLVLAHGPGDDAENERWLAHMDRQADEVRRGAPFHRVQVATLREDWPAKREQAEQAVRRVVQQSLDEGRRTIVIPYRVHGFGPYAAVLDGLDYVADRRGLLPHDGVTAWIARQAETLRTAPFSASRD